MAWDDYLNPHEQKEYECSECGEPLETDKGKKKIKKELYDAINLKHYIQDI